MSKRANVDWKGVRRIMSKCVRGSGYVMGREESRMIEAALKSDPDRYRKIHAEVKGDAVEEMTLGGCKPCR
jgi:hypothetical protein